MSPKITNYFQTSGASLPKISKKSKLDIKNESLGQDLYVVQHDHAYSSPRLRTKDEKKGENKRKILSSAKNVGVPSLPKKVKKVKEEKTVKTERKKIKPSENRIKSTPQQTLTAYFPVRRSFRKSRSKLLKEKRKDLEEAILSQREDGLTVETFSQKGRGVRATKHFRRDDFVVEYSGELIDVQEAKRREKLYSTDENTGCYMYYFTFNNKHYCVDATAESKRLGRLINHSRHGNLTTKTFTMDDVPHLILIAKCDISPGEELLYDYGDRNKSTLMVCPWLAT